MSTRDRVAGLCQIEGVNHDGTLASRFSQIKGVNPEEVFFSITGSFEVHERYSHVHI